MSKKLKIVFWIGIVVIIVVVAFFILQKPDTKTAGTEPHKIGVVMSLTGNAAEYGDSTLKGMQVALDEINIDAKKMDIILEDDNSTATGAVSAFHKIIAANNVPVVVGFLVSGGAVASAPVANESKVVMISTLCGTDDLKDAGDYVFRIRESGKAHSLAMAKFLKENLKKDSVALFYASAINGVSYADNFKREFERLGGKVVFEDQYIEKSNDFRSSLSKLKGVNPEAVYIAGMAPDMGLIINQANELGIKTQWLASPGAENSKILEITKGAAEGLIFTTPLFRSDSKNEQVEKFVENYRKKYGEDPDFASANGYDVIKLVNDMINKYGYDADKIKAGLYGVVNFDGMGGTFSFDQFGEVEKPVMFRTVKDGKFVEYR
ncbi:MAG: ABC transporter substrate-binding protein [Candidatus Buchananbacteria bacterium]